MQLWLPLNNNNNKYPENEYMQLQQHIHAIFDDYGKYNRIFQVTIVQAILKYK